MDLQNALIFTEREVYRKLDIETEPENQNIEIKETVLLL